jgi:hypothetical protein
MTAAGVILMSAAVVLFVIGFRWSADTRCRARMNIATICAAYIGLVLALSAQLRT